MRGTEMSAADADRSLSMTMTAGMTDNNDDMCKDVRLMDSAACQHWTTTAAAAAVMPHDDDDMDHHECTVVKKKLSVNESPDVYQPPPVSSQRSIYPATPAALYGRLAGTELDYDYGYGPSQYSSRYTPFIPGPGATSSYVSPTVTPYATPYSPAGLGAYLTGPCVTAAAYNASNVPHHLTSASAAVQLLTSERSAPGYRFTVSSSTSSLLQSRNDYTVVITVLRVLRMPHSVDILLSGALCLSWNELCSWLVSVRGPLQPAS